MTRRAGSPMHRAAALMLSTGLAWPAAARADEPTLNDAEQQGVDVAPHAPLDPPGVDRERATSLDGAASPDAPVSHAADVGGTPDAAASTARRGEVVPLSSDAPDDFVRVDVSAVVQALSTDNADLQATREASQDEIDETDDRATFGSTGLLTTLEMRPIEDAALRASVLWIGGFGGDGDATVSLGEASGALTLARFGDGSWSVTAGRQPFEIGGVPTDYVMDGLVDGFTSTFDTGHGIALRGLVFDLFGANEGADPHYRYSRPGRSRPSGQRGETNTYRTGAVLEAVDPFGVDGVDVRAYGFFATIGGSYIDGTGSDRSRGGLIGNFRDRDHLSVMGARAAYRAEVGDLLTLRPYFEYARASGLDRKEVNVVDVDIAGNAFGAGLEAEVTSGDVSVELGADWHRFDGAEYSVAGLEFQRGFVSMLGARTGGLASGRVAGWRPAAYLDADGIMHAPDDVPRAAGTDLLHLSLAAAWKGTSLRLGMWTFDDTRASSFDQTTLPFVDPPYGYSREEFAAQVRVGKRLGVEFDAELRQEVAKGFGVLFARGGMFMPGEYYDARISRVATPRADEGFARLGGPDGATFWAISAGAEIALSYRQGR